MYVCAAYISNNRTLFQGITVQALSESRLLTTQLLAQTTFVQKCCTFLVRAHRAGTVGGRLVRPMATSEIIVEARLGTATASARDGPAGTQHQTGVTGLLRIYTGRAPSRTTGSATSRTTAYATHWTTVRVRVRPPGSATGRATHRAAERTTRWAALCPGPPAAMHARPTTTALPHRAAGPSDQRTDDADT